MNIDIQSGIKLVRKAYEEKNNDLLMKRWLLHYQDSMSFAEFKKQMVQVVIASKKTEKEILEDVESILNLL